MHKKLPKIHIGKIPIMLKSEICVLKQYSHLNSEIVGECYADPGGYFIINGSEKVLISQEKIVPNLIQTYEISKNNSKYRYS